MIATINTMTKNPLSDFVYGAVSILSNANLIASHITSPMINTCIILIPIIAVIL